MNAQDRCDKCNAGAKNHYRLSDEMELMFCNHCDRELSEALISKGWKIVESESVTA